MSDLRPPRPAPPRGLHVGDVPVLALLAAAAVTGYLAFGAPERPLPPPVAAPAPRPAPLPAAPPPEEIAPAPAPAPGPPPAAEPGPELLPEPPSPPSPEPSPEPPPETPQTAASLLDGVRAALVEVRCADLRAEVSDETVSVTGTVTSPEDEARVRHIVEALPPGSARPPALAVAPSALCEPLLLVEPLRNANAARGRPLTVASVPDGVLSGGLDLVLDLHDVDGAGAVLVDYFTVDGGVVHLLPNPSEPAAALERDATRRIGERSGRTRFWTIGPPFGIELIVVLTSASPLFAAARPEAEPAAAYLPELKRALAGPAAESARATALFIATKAP